MAVQLRIEYLVEVWLVGMNNHIDDRVESTIRPSINRKGNKARCADCRLHQSGYSSVFSGDELGGHLIPTWQLNLGTGRLHIFAEVGILQE